MLRLERWFFSSRSQSCMCFRRSTLSHLCLPSFRSGVGRCFSLVMVFARSNVCPRKCPSFCRNGPFHRSRRWHCPQGVLPTRGRLRHLCSGRQLPCCFGRFCWPAGWSQRIVGASANSLWKGGRRRVHSVRDCLPK